MSKLPTDRFTNHTVVTAAIGLSLIAHILAVVPAFNHNDFMYAVAPTFFGERALYDGLEFVQAPGSVWIYGLVYKLVDPANAHIALRLVSLSCLLSAGFLIYRTASILVGRVAAYLLPIFLIASPFITTVGEEIGNTPLALLFLSGAVYTYFTRPLSTTSSALIGLLIGLSATSKLNFALYAIPFAIFLASDRGAFTREMRNFALGGVLGSSLIWYYFLKEPTNFWFFNVDYHYLTNISRGQTASDGAIAVAIMLAMFTFKSLPQIVLSIAASSQLAISPIGRPFLQILSLLAVSIVGAGAPLYVAFQYLAPSSLLLGLLACLAAGMLAPRYAKNKTKFWGVVFVIAALSATIYEYRLISSRVLAYTTDKIGPAVLSDMRNRTERIAQAYLSTTRCSKTALSLSPIPLIGTPFTILEYSATGPFIPRIAAQIERHAPKFSEYSDIERTLERTHPTAFVVGYYPQYIAEQRILKYAEENDFVAFPLGTLSSHSGTTKYRDLFLLIRSSCMTADAIRGANDLNAIVPMPRWTASMIHGLPSR